MDAQLLVTSVYNHDSTRHPSSLQVCFPAWRNQPKSLPFRKMFQAKSRSSWSLKQNVDSPNSNLCVHFLYFISKLILIFLRNYRFQFLLDQLCRKLHFRREHLNWGCIQIDFCRHWLPLRKIRHVLPLIVYLKAQSKLSPKLHVCVLRWKKQATLTLVWKFLREISFIFICAPNCWLSNGSKVSFNFRNFLVKFFLPNQFKIEFCFWDFKQKAFDFRDGLIWKITFFFCDRNCVNYQTPNSIVWFLSRNLNRKLTEARDSISSRMTSIESCTLFMEAFIEESPLPIFAIKMPESEKSQKFW